MPKKDLEYEVVKKLAGALLAEREAQSVSKRELSQRIGVSRTAIRTIENGERSPSVYILLKICKGLEIDLWKLIKEADKKS